MRSQTDPSLIRTSGEPRSWRCVWLSRVIDDSGTIGDSIVDTEFTLSVHAGTDTEAMTRIFIYDTTLRDGSQGEGVNFSLQDKLLITARLDEAGFDYIEGGYPLSNPKDAAYFRAVRDLELKHAKVAAFGMTRRRDVAAEDDQGMKALVSAGTPAITIVGKSWDLHVHDVLGVSLDENLRMIGDSVAFCASRVPEVIYDAEHFFDGLKRNPDYALRTIQAAAAAGAAWIVLCDTNGGALPDEIAQAVFASRARGLRSPGNSHSQ